MDRDEAMKEAVKLSDEKRKENGETKSDEPIALVLNNAKDVIAQLKDIVISVWKKKYGRAVIAGGGLALVFLLVLVSMSRCAGGEPEPIVEGNAYSSNTEGLGYQFSDAVICVYENENVSSGVSYDAFAEIVNTSDVPIKITDASFSVDTEDNSIHILTDTNLVFVPEVIMPNEKGYIFNDFGAELAVPDKKSSYSLTPSFAVEPVNEDIEEYKVSNTETWSYGGQIYTEFTIGSESGILPQYANASVVIYNDDKRCMGYGEAELKNIDVTDGRNEVKISNVIKGWAAEEPANQTIYIRDINNIKKEIKNENGNEK